MSAPTPFVDFHFGNSTTDYDVRIINGLTKTLEVTAGNGVAATFKVNGGYQCRTGTAGGYGGSLYNFNWASNAMQMFVDSSNVGTINVTSSDRELKENIEYQTDTKIAYDEVKQWRPAMFDMKVRGALSANRGLLGFIANDIKEISPEVVKGTGLPEGVDLENDDLSGMYYLDPMAAIAKLTLAIQHMQGELVELKELLNTQTP
ncbi:TPA: tail fiber domain-containing protein [Enterobacter soli]|uniref:tail fiber domain-containing protein n=1 Tax=Enterobacter soli TaxID=885040 RepID=UPI002379F8F4|nr:tail fiber domain-containing protein [Enterobacter soli]MDD9243980.1 tail fiber domain-containing protein [Enterobacter soli]